MAKWGEAATEVQKAIADGRFLTEGTETKVKSKGSACARTSLDELGDELALVLALEEAGPSLGDILKLQDPGVSMLAAPVGSY
jgi:hypothetical protein